MPYNSGLNRVRYVASRFLCPGLTRFVLSNCASFTDILIDLMSIYEFARQNAGVQTTHPRMQPRHTRKQAPQRPYNRMSQTQSDTLALRNQPHSVCETAAWRVVALEINTYSLPRFPESKLAVEALALVRSARIDPALHKCSTAPTD